MELDCYKVEILHYLNPHLIWVEVTDSKRDEEFVFEQLGIYGLLPYETTIDLNGETLKSQRCPEWIAAATVVMKKVLGSAVEVFFQQTFIDRRSSIFDDNIHKYGELIVNTVDGRKLKLSQSLVDSGFALYDVCLFHQELSLGNLKTKLSIVKAREVIKYLEKDNIDKVRECKVKKQTAVLQAAQSFETTLTMQNLERHNRQLSGMAIDNLIQKKMKDFDRCKDIDEESIGRAISLKQNLKEHQSSLLRKKMELFKLQKSQNSNKEQKNSQNDPLKVLLAAKQVLEVDANTTGNKLNADDSLFSEENKFQENRSHHSSSENDIVINTENNQVTNSENIIQKKRKSNKQHKISEYDIVTEKRIAFGPPGFNLTQLPMKIVPKGKETEEINLVSEIDDKVFVEREKEPFADVDSMVNFEITEIDRLKEIKNKHVNCDDNYLNRQQTKNANAGSLDNTTTNEQKQEFAKLRSAVLQRKLKLHKEISSKQSDHSETLLGDRINKALSDTSHSDTVNEDLLENSNFNTINKDSSTSIDGIQSKKEGKKSETIKCDYLDSDDDVTEIFEEMNVKYGVPTVKIQPEAPKEVIKADSAYINNVNPFKNVDDTISVFVDKLVAPVLMVHSKMNQRIEPCSNLRDANFNTHIQIVLKNLSIVHPMMLQMISWPVILRGFSLFLVSPLGSGKTIGYLPAVCRLVTDFTSDSIHSVGPICIIVCATAQSVAEVDKLARMFLGVEERVLSCFAGMDELHMTTSLLNGCDLFICTPSVLVRLMQLTDFGVDLRRLSTFVLDDCERLSEVYAKEIKCFLAKIKEAENKRVNKELKVQFIAASRVWCEFMAPLARKAPNSVICIGAFQECVLYSKTNTIVDFVKKENKIKRVLEFLKGIDDTKKTVIVCRSDDEVEELGKVLRNHKYVVFSCNNTMTVEELYDLSQCWVEYEEPLLGPILICCDGNLTHLNATDAHYLIHYSLPHLFSMFCRRFSALNNNYSSIFKEEKQSLKIKVFLEEDNLEQLPKILNFIKRCTDVPEFLESVSVKILQEKDVIKGKNLVPICDNLLTLGECPDFWNCQERHGIFKQYDQLKDWMPRSGVVTFKILHYHTAVHYSARLLSNSTKGNKRKYPQTYNVLHMKLGMYFSKESNRKLHGIPKVGDICAVSVKQNFFARCQVLKILNRYNNGTPNCVLINLLDDERLERARDIFLYHLPEDLKSFETHIVHVRLVNIRPKDNDITFSDLAKNQLKKITDKEEDLYLRGEVVMTIGNCIFVNTLEACHELTSLNETVVRYNFKKELLETHAITNPDHMTKLSILCKDFDCAETEVIVTETIKPKKQSPKPQWAHLEIHDFSQVFFASAVNPGTFFVRLTNFEPCMKLVLQEIDKYVKHNPNPVVDIHVGDILLAKFPDDATFERARVDDILGDDKVRCFFVDQGDWAVVATKDLLQIPDKLVTLIPFQAIECSLVGVKPAGDDWTEFGTNWFTYSCFENKDGDIKQLYVKYFNKIKADYTDGHKYGVVLVDTTTEQDILINQLMIDLNLAQEKEEEVHFFTELNINNATAEESSTDSEIVTVKKNPNSISKSLVPVNNPKDTPNVPLDNIFLKKPIRSVPLVDSDNESENSDKWEIVNAKEVVSSIISQPSSTPPNNQSYASTNKISSTENLIKNSMSKNIPAISSSKLGFEKSCLSTSVIHDEPKSMSSTLDSDDLSSAEGSQLAEKAIKEKQNDHNSTEIDELRKPKLVWWQNSSTVYIKIQLIGAEEYNVEIKERSIKFSTYLNDTYYGFDFELYGVIESNCSVHSNKGQYILVKLAKIIKKNWLTLTRDGCMRKWIVYDVDSIDTSSDEEDVPVNYLAEMVKSTHNRDAGSESDDDLLDDINFEYKRDYD
ncbi:unnamed protein product [Diatraea saccharalis]|uniref:RNA helicase n=1 Tax=Diatraea saccharalis TaxID=40085 RepID=A0A9N9WIK1_9NEOP|nr:unnamed protein product [Diatraea saccharalis]